MLDKSDRLEYYKLFFLQNGYENDIAQTNFPWESVLEACKMEALCHSRCDA